MAKDTKNRKGFGSIFKRGDVWVAQVNVGRLPSGKPKYKQVRFKTEKEAKEKLKELLAEQSKGVFIASGKHTVSSWLDYWLEEHVKSKREPKTHQFYSWLCTKWIKPYLGSAELGKLSPLDVSSFFKAIAKEKATPNTVEATRRTLRAALGVAEKFEVIEANPVTKTFSSKVKRKPRIYFDAEEVQRLIEALKGSPIENLVLFTLATGMRVGESSGVTWDTVDLTNNTVFVSQQLQRIDKKLTLKQLKTEKARRVMPLVGHSLEAVLAEKVRRDAGTAESELNLVFTNPWGRGFDPKFISKHLHLALEKAKLPKTGMHSLRHSAATFMLMAGLNLHQVSRYIGHSNINLTSSIYGHVLSDGVKDAAEKLQAAYMVKKDEKKPTIEVGNLS